MIEKKFECLNCKAIVTVSAESDGSEIKCCKNPKLELAAYTYDDKDAEKAMKSLREAYDSLIKIYQKYLDWDSEEIKLQAIWVIGTYLYKEFRTFPYKYINAMKGSGKTRLLKLTEVLSWKGKLVVNMSDSALFRLADSHTLIFDEAEGITNKEKQTQREILNSGYKKGGKITRTKEKYTKDGKDWETVDFNVYSPKMIANITGMDEVVGDRCITSQLQRSGRKNVTKLLEDFETNEEILSTIKILKCCYVVWCCFLAKNNCIEKWNDFVTNNYTNNTKQHTHITTLNNTKQHITPQEEVLFNKINNLEIDGRNLELYFPLFIISQMVGEDVLDDILNIADKKVKEKREEDTYENKDILFICFVSSQESNLRFISIKELAYNFNQTVDSDEEGKTWANAKWVGKALKRLQLISKSRRTAHGREVILNVLKARSLMNLFKDKDLP